MARHKCVVRTTFFVDDKPFLKSQNAKKYRKGNHTERKEIRKRQFMSCKNINSMFPLQWPGSMSGWCIKNCTKQKNIRDSQNGLTLSDPFLKTQP